MDQPLDTGELLGPILQALAESLDVREIFARISVEARRIIPHEFLLLGLLSDDHERVTVIALSGALEARAAELPIPVSLRSAIEEGTFTMSDVQKVGDGKTIRATMRLAGHDESRVVEYPTQRLFDHLIEEGYLSFLRVAVRLRGTLVGGLIFCSRSRDGFSGRDFGRARPIADCVALAISHQLLTAGQQRRAEARERASLLEMRVQRLTEELDAQGRHRTLGHSPA